MSISFTFLQFRETHNLLDESSEDEDDEEMDDDEDDDDDDDEVSELIVAGRQTLYGCSHMSGDMNTRRISSVHVT